MTKSMPIYGHKGDLIYVIVVSIVVIANVIASPICVICNWKMKRHLRSIETSLTVSVLLMGLVVLPLNVIQLRNPENFRNITNCFILTTIKTCLVCLTDAHMMCYFILQVICYRHPLKVVSVLTNKMKTVILITLWSVPIIVVLWIMSTLLFTSVDLESYMDICTYAKYPKELLYFFVLVMLIPSSTCVLSMSLMYVFVTMKQYREICVLSDITQNSERRIPLYGKITLACMLSTASSLLIYNIIFSVMILSSTSEITETFDITWSTVYVSIFITYIAIVRILLQREIRQHVMDLLSKIFMFK